ncbi:MAG: arginine--tRNA ligase [Lentisphaerales bacterium]|jgi:arginyl-tRNA synthetase|nr:MAG: arginine--tRNA ligase [Lentisphaerales bacterium]
MINTSSSFVPVDRELSAWIRLAFESAYPEAGSVLARISTVPTMSPEFGDYQCNDAMNLARALKIKPRVIAERLIAVAGPHPGVARMEIAGPGFVNVFLEDSWISDRLAAMAGAGGLGLPSDGAGKTVIVDYSSPNVAKPMHIGHIRSTVIGNSLYRIHSALGYRTVSDNHIGDWGTQFGIIIMGYRHFLDQKALETSPIEELERVYVKSYEKSREDADWLNECRRELVKLQSGDEQNVALWKDFVALSLREFEGIYRRLGVSFDIVRGESYYRDKLAGVVRQLEEKELARESEGAMVVFMEEDKLPPCIVRKSDGGYNYASSDLATVASRVDEFGPDRIIYVTDERQQLHFRQIFAISRKLGCSVSLEHVWFGLMRLPEGTFSTREGNVIKLERLLDEAESRALAIVTASSPDMPEERRREVARVVGIGAIKYADLSQNPQTTVTFTWEKALALDGNSGPYLQYAYARIASVRDKFAERFPGIDPDGFPIVFTQQIERTLALKLLKFPEAVTRAAQACKPSTVADYLYDLAQSYSTFYQNVPFLKAEDGVRESRVRLCGITAKVLKSGLDLLGIETQERI